jgi:hypothetical protein
MVAHSRAARKIVDDIELQASESKSGHGKGLIGNIASRAHTSALHSSATMRQRRAAVTQAQDRRKKSLHHQTGLGTFPAPWDSRSLRRWANCPFKNTTKKWERRDHSYVSFDAKFDERGRFRELNELERCELGGVEYRALGVLLYILIAYQIFWLALGTVFLVPYSYRASVVDILDSSQPGNLNPGWFAFYSVITSYANGVYITASPTPSAY